MGDDPRGDDRVRRLHQERAAAAEHQHALAADRADRVAVGEVAGHAVETVRQPSLVASSNVKGRRRATRTCDRLESTTVTSTEHQDTLTTRLEFSPRRLRSGGQVRWVIHVSNSGDTPRTLRFGSAQRGDVALHQRGVERYRWSRGRVFMAVMDERALGAGENWALALEDSLNVEAGRYELTAIVSAVPAPPPLLRTVVVDPLAP